MLKLGNQRKLIMVYIYVIIFLLSGFAAADPLHEAVKEGNIDEVNRLIGEGTDLNFRDESSATPLYIAVDHGNKEMAELLILKGANVNAVDKTGYTPLWHAVNWGNSKAIRELLIKHGAKK